MSSEIKAGDRVMLVWGCCAVVRRSIGSQYTVFCIYTPQRDRILVTDCGCYIAQQQMAVHLPEPGAGVPLSWLRKMPPDAEHIDEDVATPIESTTL